MELNTQAQQREAVVQGRSLSPYRLRYNVPNPVWVKTYCPHLLRYIFIAETMEYVGAKWE
ncbi:MAG: hypothetical protein LBJ00_14665 [Planctomycetaceae bacterium]|nr:hypothetical protein [Planctomycetaceae bacterium]